LRASIGPAWARDASQAGSEDRRGRDAIERFFDREPLAPIERLRPRQQLATRDVEGK